MSTVFDLSLAFYRSQREWPADRLPGFQWQRGHFIPDSHGLAAVEFYQDLLREGCEQKIDLVYEKAKALWGWKAKEMKRIPFGIQTPAFSFTARISQASERPQIAILGWCLNWSTELAYLREYNLIFPEPMEEWVVPLPLARSFEFWVERLEQIAEEVGGRVIDNPRLQKMEYRSHPEVNLCIQIYGGELICSPLHSSEGTFGLLQLSQKIRPILQALC